MQENHDSLESPGATSFLNVASDSGRETLSFLTRMLNAVADPIFVKDEQHRWILFNDAFSKLIGESREDLLNKTDHDFFPKEQCEVFWEKDQLVLDAGELVINEEFLTDSSGSVHTLITKKTRLIDERGNKYLVGVIRDVTEQKRIEAELLAARCEAEQSSAMKTAFLANVSHEIRTPMHGVLGTLNLLLEEKLDSNQRDLAETSRTSAESMLHVINDILDFSKIESGRLTLVQIAFDLRELIQSIKQSCAAAYREKSLELAIELSEDLPSRVIGDPDRLRQIILNLLDNARKFTPPGGLVLLKATSEVTGESTLQISFSITDTGVGIPREKQYRIFDAFTQVDSSLSRRAGGTGLGLAICAQLTKLMGGGITVQSNGYSGSTFRFHVEMQRAANYVIPEPRNFGKLKEEPTVSRPLRILVVEDNRVNQKVAKRILEGVGHQVALAGNGKEALELLRVEVFDIVLMDIQMPLMDGVQATARIRASNGAFSGIPIIALTAHAMHVDKERYLASGMNGYLPKPVTKSEMIAEIERVMEISSE